MNDWQENNPSVKQLLTLKQRSHKRKMLRRLLLTALVVTLLVLSLLVTSCATHSRPPSEQPIPTSKPVPDKSMPSVMYSEQVRKWLDEWQAKLIAGQSKP